MNKFEIRELIKKRIKILKENKDLNVNPSTILNYINYNNIVSETGEIKLTPNDLLQIGSMDEDKVMDLLSASDNIKDTLNIVSLFSFINLIETNELGDYQLDENGYILISEKNKAISYNFSSMLNLIEDNFYQEINKKNQDL